MITSPGKLFKLSFAVKGWTAITDLNFKRLNSVLLYVPGIGDVQTSGALQHRDLLVWNASTQKWVVTHFYDYFQTTTTTTTTSSSSSSSSTTTTEA
jgi:hypothetical protein